MSIKSSINKVFIIRTCIISYFPYNYKNIVLACFQTRPIFWIINSKENFLLTQPLEQVGLSTMLFRQPNYLAVCLLHYMDTNSCSLLLCLLCHISALTPAYSASYFAESAFSIPACQC